MFNDTLEVAVLRFIPAYSRSKCHPIIPLMMHLSALAAICFAPAYAGNMVNTFGIWSLWVWMGMVTTTILVALAITPRPAADTYIVYAENKDVLGAYSDEFEIENRFQKNTYRLTRKCVQ